MKPGDVVYYWQWDSLFRGTVKEVRRTKMDLTATSGWIRGAWVPFPYGGAAVEIAHARPTLAEAVAFITERNAAEIAGMQFRIDLLNEMSEKIKGATP